MTYSKADQTKKKKRVNLKKLPPIELRLFKEFIFDKADGKCQSGCNRPIDTYHHGDRGAYKDDRTLGGICDMCHEILHFSTDSQKRKSLTVLFKSLGIENWREYSD